MKKVAVLSAVIVLGLLIKYAVEWQGAYASRIPDYPDGPTVNGQDLYTDPLTATIYKSASMDKESLFSGTSVKFHPNGKLFVKAGIKRGSLHGPFDLWHENGQKHMSMVWIHGKKIKNFKAYQPNGERISGNDHELAEQIFGDVISTQP